MAPCVEITGDVDPSARAQVDFFFLKSVDVCLQQAADRGSAFARRGHRNTFENSLGKDATTITA